MEGLPAPWQSWLSHTFNKTEVTENPDAVLDALKTYDKIINRVPGQKYVHMQKDGVRLHHRYWRVKLTMSVLLIGGQQHG